MVYYNIYEITDGSQPTWIKRRISKDTPYLHRLMQFSNSSLFSQPAVHKPLIRTSKDSLCGETHSLFPLFVVLVKDMASDKTKSSHSDEMRLKYTLQRWRLASFSFVQSASAKASGRRWTGKEEDLEPRVQQPSSPVPTSIRENRPCRVTGENIDQLKHSELCYELQITTPRVPLSSNFLSAEHSTDTSFTVVVHTVNFPNCTHKSSAI